MTYFTLAILGSFPLRVFFFWHFFFGGGGRGGGSDINPYGPQWGTGGVWITSNSSTYSCYIKKLLLVVYVWALVLLQASTHFHSLKSVLTSVKNSWILFDL